MGATVSLSHVVSASPSSSGGRFLTLFPCSSVVSLTWETVLHKLLQRESFTRAAALHELPQCGSFPQGAGLQEQALQCGSPPGSQALPANLLWRGLISPQVCRCLQGSQLHSGIHLIWSGVPSMVYRWISAPPWTSMDCVGTTCLTIIFITSCKGIVSAQTFQEPPPPPSSLTWVSAGLFLSHFLTPLS